MCQHSAIKQGKLLKKKTNLFLQKPVLCYTGVRKVISSTVFLYSIEITRFTPHHLTFLSVYNFPLHCMFKW